MNPGPQRSKHSHLPEFYRLMHLSAYWPPGPEQGWQQWQVQDCSKHNFPSLPYAHTYALTFIQQSPCEYPYNTASRPTTLSTHALPDLETLSCRSHLIPQSLAFAVSILLYEWVLFANKIRPFHSRGHTVTASPQPEQRSYSVQGKLS